MRMRAVIRAVVCVALMPAGSAHAKVKVIDQRIDASPGGVLVVPVEVGRRFDLRRSHDIRAGDGRRIDAGIWWVSTAPPPTPTTGPDWTPAARTWTAIGGLKAWRTRDADDPSGRWVVVADLPGDLGEQALTYRGQALGVHWLEAFEPVAPDSKPDEPAPGVDFDTDLVPVLADGPPPTEDNPPVPATGSSIDASNPPPRFEVIEALHADPDTQWRAHLIAGRLDALPALDTPIDTPQGIIDRLAHARTLRWRAALDRVGQIAPDLAHELGDRLAMSVRSGEGVLPAWVGGPALEADLLVPLLDPGSTDKQIERRVRGWLLAQPGAVVWVIDDAGQQTATGSLATLGVVSLAATGGAVLVRTEPGTAATPDDTSLSPATIEPRVVDRLPLPIHSGREGAGLTLRSARVPVRVGAWRGRLEVVTSALAARPPGVRLGPLLNRWTMTSWLGQRGGGDAVPPPARATAALLQRTQHPGDDRTSHGWELIVECAFAAGTTTADDAVTIWLGAFGSPSAVIDLRPNGIATRRGLDELLPDVESSGVIESDRWIVRVHLPSDAIDDDGTLLIGLSRTDATGWTTSWPRRMMPGQEEPGRIAFDLTAWDGLGRD